MLFSVFSSILKDTEGVATILPFLFLAATPVFLKFDSNATLGKIQSINPLTHYLEGVSGVVFANGFCGDTNLIVSAILSVLFWGVLWLFTRVSLPYLQERFIR